MEMVLKARQQVERLQTINAKRLKEIIVGREFFPRNFEMRGREANNLLEGLAGSLHKKSILQALGALRQVRHRLCALYKLFEPGFDSRPRK